MRFIGIDKERNLDASRRQARTGITHFIALSGHIQAAFGGDFLAFFRHQTTEMRPGFYGDRQHLFGHRHLQIHTRMQRLTQNAHIAIGNVATIFAQVYGNAVRACLFSNKRRLYRIRIVGAARIT
ncbi:Uncharacterised protein [Salmonella enterica subsp. enterica serovar Bovismorbificans]|nr:Uncharacterised protein [Salmonella enterica subsp. enterica serovar Bovismorbificans]